MLKDASGTGSIQIFFFLFPFEDSCSLLKDSELEVKHCTPFTSITDHEAEHTAIERAFVSDSVSLIIFQTQYTHSQKAPTWDLLPPGKGGKSVTLTTPVHPSPGGESV